MRGLRRSARAMATRCFCPPDICTPFSPMCVSYLHAVATHSWCGQSRVNIYIYAKERDSLNNGPSLPWRYLARL